MAQVEGQTHRSDRSERSETDPHTYSCGGPTGSWWGKDSLFNKWCWSKWTCSEKKKESQPKLTPCTKTDAKWITDLTVKCKIIKLLGKKQEEIFGIQHLSGEFLDWTPTE